MYLMGSPFTCYPIETAAYNGPVLSFLKDNLLPGSFSLLIFGLLAGVALMRAPGAWGRWGRRWLVLIVAMYSLMSIPVVSLALAAPLQRGWTPITAEDASGADAIVVLGGGVWTYRGSGLAVELPGGGTLRRLLEAARVYRMLGDPIVVLSGGTVMAGQRRSEAVIMRDLLVSLGLPESRIVLEESSRNTHDQARQIRTLLDRLGARRFVLVTSPFHMPRAVGAFRAQHLAPLPSAGACCDWEGRPDGLWLALPTDAALQLSSAAAYEYLGVAYYWLRGWM